LDKTKTKHVYSRSGNIHIETSTKISLADNLQANLRLNDERSTKLFKEEEAVVFGVELIVAVEI
jgi:hypothetical protein